MKTITEREILLIGRRLNNKRDLKEMQKVYNEAINDEVFLLRDLVFNNMQFCDTEEEREQYQKTFDRLTTIQDEVILF